MYEQRPNFTAMRQAASASPSALKDQPCGIRNSCVLAHIYLRVEVKDLRLFAEVAHQDAH